MQVLCSEEARKYNYRWYHVNSPPPFLADFGDRSKTGFKGIYQILRYHANSPPPFLSEKNVPGGGGISMISTVHEKKNHVRKKHFAEAIVTNY